MILCSTTAAHTAISSARGAQANPPRHDPKKTTDDGRRIPIYWWWLLLLHILIFIIFVAFDPTIRIGTRTRARVALVNVVTWMGITVSSIRFPFPFAMYMYVMYALRLPATVCGRYCLPAWCWGAAKHSNRKSKWPTAAAAFFPSSTSLHEMQVLSFFLIIFEFCECARLRSHDNYYLLLFIDNKGSTEFQEDKKKYFRIWHTHTHITHSDRTVWHSPNGYTRELNLPISCRWRKMRIIVGLGLGHLGQVFFVES